VFEEEEELVGFTLEAKTDCKVGDPRCLFLFLVDCCLSIEVSREKEEVEGSGWGWLVGALVESLPTTLP